MDRKDIIKSIADFWGDSYQTAACLTDEGLRYELRGMEKQGVVILWALVDRILD
ncbi:MAG: hypothetical protein PHU71_05760 [Candidatus Gracilibacteria bacterium]|nr:hypothetical protein [Candidatus Gracilibacteria bacterium]